MRGSINWQVQQVYAQVNSIGHSKHSTKAQVRSHGSATFHDIAKGMGIYSYATADAYRDVWRSAMEYAKTQYRIKDIEKLSGEHIKGYLNSKIEQGISHSTFMLHAAALEKLETALNRYAETHLTGQQYNFSDSFNEARLEAHDKLERFDGSRAYSNPESLIQQLHGIYQLAASLQYESGGRVHEISLIKAEQLSGINSDSITGNLKGHITIQSKGGKENILKISPETYAKLEHHIRQNGEFKIDKNYYRADLQNASVNTNQHYNGSHGLRWSFAQERFQEIQQHGYTYEQALTQTSHEMGHERADITEHYLR